MSPGLWRWERTLWRLGLVGGVGRGRWGLLGSPSLDRRWLPRTPARRDLFLITITNYLEGKKTNPTTTAKTAIKLFFFFSNLLLMADWLYIIKRQLEICQGRVLEPRLPA